MSDRDLIASVISSYSQLLSLAVHEFRTPASVVSGYLRMLQRDADAVLNERQHKMIEEAAKSCGRIVELVAEMSEISKLDSASVTIKREDLDLFQLLQKWPMVCRKPTSARFISSCSGEPAGAHERRRPPSEQRLSGLFQSYSCASSRLTARSSSSAA